MRHSPINRQYAVTPTPTMAGTQAGRQASRSLDGAHSALMAAKKALEAAPHTDHTRDGLKAITRALREVQEATSCSDHMCGRVRW